MSHDASRSQNRAHAPRGPQTCRPSFSTRALESLDEASRSSGSRRVASRQVGELVRNDRPKLTLGEHPEQRQANQQGTRAPPGNHATARKVGQAHLPWRFHPEPPPDRVDRREQKRCVHSGHDRPQVAVWILSDDRKPDAAQRRHHVRPAA